MGEMGNLQAQAIAVLGLSAITLTGLAIVQGFKNTALVDNTTADKFIAGLTIFGTFVGIIILAIVGKVIVGLFRRGA